MKIFIHRSVPIVLRIVFSPCLLLGQCQATISGKVIDEQGIPLGHASVLAVKLGGALYPGNRIFGPFETDADGNFHGTANVTGHRSYFLSAKKEDSGYPNAILSFYINHVPPKFILSCNSSHSGIVLRVGPKAAYIQHISVLDADSARPIADASIRLWRLTSPLRYLPESELGITASTRLTPPTILLPVLALAHENDPDPELRSWKTPPGPELRKEVLGGLSVATQRLWDYFRSGSSRTPARGPATSSKVGRNDPCYCGSGKKYKRCCGSVTVH